MLHSVDSNLLKAIAVDSNLPTMLVRAIPLYIAPPTHRHQVRLRSRSPYPEPGESVEGVYTCEVVGDGVVSVGLYYPSELRNYSCNRYHTSQVLEQSNSLSVVAISRMS